MANQSGRRTSRRSPTRKHLGFSPRSGKYQRCPVSDYKPATPATQDWGEDFTVRSQQDLLQTADNVTGILILMLATTASISLLGGIGIMNIMLVSVTERTSGNWPAQSDWRNEHRCAGPIHH